MKLTALLLLFAIIGKMSAVPVRYPVRLAYYRAAPALQEQEQPLDDDVEDEDEADVSDEVNFSSTPIQDDDDDSEEQEEPPQFQKLFPLPQRNSPGHNFPLSIMMGEIGAQGWKVPKHPQGQQQQQRDARDAIQISRDDDDDDSDEEDDDEDEEDDEDTEDDLPQWGKLFPNLEAEANAGPPSDLVDTSTQPELPASYRSGLGGSRLVYIPAGRSFRQTRRPSPQTVSRQYVLRNPSPPRSQVVYTMASPSYMNRQITVEFLVRTIKESMLVFREFLHSDKSSKDHGAKIDTKDPEILPLLADIITTLQKKERRLKENVRSKSCIVKMMQKQEERDQICTCEVELRLVSKVIGLSKVSRDQLIWCQNKLLNINFVSRRRVHLEPSFLLFPC